MDGMHGTSSVGPEIVSSGILDMNLVLRARILCTNIIPVALIAISQQSSRGNTGRP
jgi:hypothetical protein